jgi:hypothetical protein
MPRLTYQAPGVYVEEIPSARQPIAAVGTNTAAFVGIVPDTIFYPVPNDNYDPVAAREAIGKAGTSAAPEGTIAEKPQAVVARLDRELAELRTLEAAATDDDKRKFNKAIKDKEKERATAAAAAAPTPPEIETEDLAYEDGEPDNELLAPSESRPYYLRTFNVGVAPGDTKFCTNFTEYANLFGTFSAFRSGADARRPLHPGHHALTHAVYGFFKNGGSRCFVARLRNAADLEKTLRNFESIDDVALVAAPGLPKNAASWEALTAYSEDENRQNVFAILDSPKIVGTTDEFDIQRLTYSAEAGEQPIPRPSKNAAFYFPQIEVIDPAKQIQDSDPRRGIDPKFRGRTYIGPSGHMAGIYARTDEERGVHKAPANCVVRGAVNVKYYVSKAKQEILNPQGVNVIRSMNGAITVWGARTIGGDRNGEWKYISVRRFFLFLQESIDEGTQWVVFEPNDYTLWGKIRLNVTAFLTNVWRSGALFGLTPEEAFYVKCDAELNPPEVRDLGQVVTEIGVAIVRPAEFVIFRISQSTGRENA